MLTFSRSLLSRASFPLTVSAGGKDFCYDPNDDMGGSDGNPQVKYLGQEYCDSNPCGLCEGDCDNDDGCSGDLKCFQRDGNEPVPGCSGGEGSDTSK